MKVFFDTSAFIALFVKKDFNHPKVFKKYQEYKKYRAYFLTSDYVLDELYTRLIYDFGKKVCAQVIKSLGLVEKAGELEILKVDQSIFQKSLKVIIRFAEHKISFTDATIFTMFKDFKLDELFTLDSDFKKLRIPVSFL